MRLLAIPAAFMVACLSAGAAWAQAAGSSGTGTSSGSGSGPAATPLPPPETRADPGTSTRSRTLSGGGTRTGEPSAVGRTPREEELNRRSIELDRRIKRGICQGC